MKLGYNDGMSTPTPRKAKYCPRCGTMTFPETVQCAHCGHRFQTGMAAEQAPSVPKPDANTPKPVDDPANHTRMFDMPPALSARPPKDAPIPTPLNPVVETRTRGSQAAWWLIAAVCVALVAGLAAMRLRTRSADAAMLVGSWTNTQASGAEVSLDLNGDSAGMLRWTGTSAGNIPVRWGLDRQGALALVPSRGIPAGTVGRDSVMRMTGRSWPYVVDKKAGTLTLGGSLTFRRDTPR